MQTLLDTTGQQTLQQPLWKQQVRQKQRSNINSKHFNSNLAGRGVGRANDPKQIKPAGAELYQTVQLRIATPRVVDS